MSLNTVSDIVKFHHQKGYRVSYENTDCKPLGNLHMVNLSEDMREGTRLCKLASIMRRDHRFLTQVIQSWSMCFESNSLACAWRVGLLVFCQACEPFEVRDTLVRLHGYEIFHDGAFNWDPHPGNVLLMPDGKLRLIDYGEVKRMSVSDGIIFAKLIIALDKEDREEVVRTIKDDTPVRTKNINDDVLYRTTAFFNRRGLDDVTMSINVSERIQLVETTYPVRKINSELVMVGRTVKFLHRRDNHVSYENAEYEPLGNLRMVHF